MQLNILKFYRVGFIIYLSPFIKEIKVDIAD